jgi:hypothetical protein
MSANDYIPHGFNELQIWLLRFLNYLQANLTRFGIISGTEKPLEMLIDAFVAANAKANMDNAGSSDRVDRKEKADAATVGARDFVNTYLRYNAAVTDPDRESLGLTIPDKHPTPAPPPHSHPDIKFYATGDVCCVGIELRDSESESKAKPEHVHGAELRYAILPAPPVDDTELVHSEFTTRATHELQFTESERGKTVYVFARWENTRGQKGHRSMIYATIVP